MRLRLVTINVLLLFAVSHAACGGSSSSPGSSPTNPTPPTPAPPKGSMSAIINGASWAATLSVNGSVNTYGFTVTGTSFLNTDPTSSGTSITLSVQIPSLLQPWPGIGTYPIGTSTIGNHSLIAQGSMIVKSSGTPILQPWAATSGTITVGTLTATTTSGTFSLVMQSQANPTGPTTSVSSGSFSFTF